MTLARPFAVVAVLLLAACAKETLPPVVVQAESMVRAAEAQGLAQVAPDEMRAARDSLDAAKASANRIQASRLAEEAIAQTELADAKAAAARAGAAPIIR